VSEPLVIVGKGMAAARLVDELHDRVAERREGGARTRHVRLYRRLPRYSRHERFSCANRRRRAL
jgi:hypothetical protein